MNPKDRHLDTPSEANRDKHINFAALENNDEDPADAPSFGKLSPEDPGGTKNEQTLDVVVDNVDYFVRIIPFDFNDETRYYVSVNDGPNHLFVWDEQMRHIRSLDADASVLPAGLVIAINRQLISSKK